MADVPADPGVPPVADIAASSDDTVTVMASDTPGIDLSGQWGIFTADGAPAIDFDTISAFGARKDYRISSYPIEQGQFASYNKVETPGENRVTLVMGRTLQDRTQFLVGIDALVDSILLYSIATPEKTYLDVNPTGYDLSRTSSNGVTMISVDLRFDEVRTTVVSQYTTTATADAMDSVDGGPVLPRDPTAAEIPPIDSSLEGAPGFTS